MERYIKTQENEMCEEEILSKRMQLQAKMELQLDLQLELSEIYAELDRAKCEEQGLVEYMHCMEVRLCVERRDLDRRTAESRQRRRWGVRQSRTRCVTDGKMNVNGLSLII